MRSIKHSTHVSAAFSKNSAILPSSEILFFASVGIGDKQYDLSSLITDSTFPSLVRI